MAQTGREIRELLSSRGLSPRRRLGQNFLLDHNLIEKLAGHVAPVPGGVVLEIGPGTGAMTGALLERGFDVVACELDAGLARLLRETLCVAHPRLALIEGDCLDGKRGLNPALTRALGGRPFVLASNLPYGAGTPVMMTLLTSHPECGSMAVTIQREVGDRLGARPSTDAYGAISVVAQLAARVRTIARLGPECFWPRPEVDSVMVTLQRRTDSPCDTGELAGVAGFCAAIFGKRRKQLGTILGREGPWPQGILPEARAESLEPEQILGLWRALRDSGRGFA